MSLKLGKIKVYGKIIDLDEMTITDLKKVNEILNDRLDQLCENYINLYNDTGITS